MDNRNLSRVSYYCIAVFVYKKLSTKLESGKHFLTANGRFCPSTKPIPHPSPQIWNPLNTIIVFLQICDDGLSLPKHCSVELGNGVGTITHSYHSNCFGCEILLNLISVWKGKHVMLSYFYLWHFPSSLLFRFIFLLVTTFYESFYIS